MNQPYFIVVLAHSLHGRIRRFHVDQKVVLAVLGLAVLGAFILFGMASSYLRMAWKVANYNNLRQETEFLRARYQKLLNESNQTTEQMASLQTFAHEVSVAYGIQKSPPTGLPSVNADERLLPTFSETLDQYNMLKSAQLTTSSRAVNRRWMVNTKPAIWPLAGRLLSHFGRREDPFSGHQAFHAGVDLSAAIGTPVRATADGIVTMAAYSGAYGKLIVVDHGNSLSTYYAHLSRIDMIPGQEVRMGQTIGATGATGRVTSPHLHYEVRIGGSPVNPYPYLARSAMTPGATGRDFGF